MRISDAGQSSSTLMAPMQVIRCHSLWASTSDQDPAKLEPLSARKTIKKTPLFCQMGRNLLTGTRLQCTLRIQTEQAATFLSGLTSIQTKLYLIYATQNFSSMFGVVNGKQKKKKVRGRIFLWCFSGN